MFFTPSGKALFDTSPPPALAPNPVERLISRNRERGVAADWRSGAPRYKRDDLIPWAIEAAALEAIDPVEEPRVA